jgi:hypothetical protein
MRFLVASMLLSLTATLAAQDAAPPTFEEQSKTLEQEIADTARIDVKLGRHLAAQLDYAQVLARNTSVENCAARLPQAESHFKIAKDSVVTPLVLTAARGRIPTVAYYVEAARARCSPEAAAKTAALNAALAFAREAVSGYRAAFMYEPMAIMQFNVAETMHDLGDTAQAVKELEAAIDMDRTFGFKADAEENFRTLNQWREKKITDEELAAFLAPFAPKSVTLKIGWTPSRVEAGATFDNATFEGNTVKHTKFSVPMSGSIKAEKELLVYEVKTGEPAIDATALGSDVEKKLVALLARVLAKVPAAEIGTGGEFKAARNLEDFARQLNAEIDKAITSAVPASDPRHPGVKAAMDEQLRPFTTADNLLARIQQGYSLETGIWIDATLEQNAWMSLPLTLSMNGTPQGFIEHAVQVVVARRLPCAAGQPADGCVELLIEALPAPKAVEEVAAKLQEGGQGRLDYAAATRVRLVVDPATLVPWENEMLRYSYLALANKGQRAVQIATEQSKVRYRYRK